MVGEYPKRRRIKIVRGRGRVGEGSRESAKEGRRHPSFREGSCCGGCSSGVIFNLVCCCCFVQVMLGFLAKVKFIFG